MSDWVKVAPIEELPPGSRRVVDVDGVAVAVFNLGGDYCAIEDTCTHDGGELASGELQGEEIVCPRHGAHFNLRTGAVPAPPWPPFRSGWPRAGWKCATTAGTD